MEGIREAGRGDATGAGRALTRAVLAGLALATCAVVLGQELTTSNPEARQRYAQGMDRLRARDWAGAAREFSAAKDLDPKFPEAYVGLGQARANLGFSTDALSCFETAVRLKPDFVEARISLAVALLASKFNDRAESEAKRVLQQDRDRPEAYILLAQVAMLRAGDLDDPKERVAGYEKAVEQLSRAVELRSSDPEYRRNLAMALLAAGRVAEAAEELRQAVEINRNNSLYRRELGEVYFHLERHAEASAQLLLAHFDPQRRDKGLYILLMRSALQLGLYREGAIWAAHAQKAAQNDPQILLMSASVHRYWGNHRLAEQFIRQALLIDPKLAGADYELGMLYFDRGEWRPALEFLRKATDIVPDDYRAWYQLGLAYRRVGQVAESDQALAKFKELKDAEQAQREQDGIEAGPPDRPVFATSQPATRPAGSPTP